MSEIIQTEFKELDDPVYSHMKESMVPGHKLIGAIIDDVVNFSHNTARKIISFKVMDLKGEMHTFSYNYNKILRAVQKLATKE